jgi:TPR repeat protein
MQHARNTWSLQTFSMQHLLKAAFATCLLTLASAGTAFAGPFEDGVAALDRRDYATALLLLRPLAENGNADAQINLANMYFVVREESVFRRR